MNPINTTSDPRATSKKSKGSTWASKAASTLTAALVLYVQFQNASARSLSRMPKTGASTALTAPVAASLKAAPKSTLVPPIFVTGLPGGDGRPDFRPVIGYNGGPLIKSPVVTTLAWGSGESDNGVRNFAAANSFVADLPRTKYMGWIQKDYSVPKIKLKGGHFRHELVIDPAFKKLVKDKEIQAAIAQLMRQKALPNNSFGNALTMVFLPPRVSVQGPVASGGGRSCIDFCAYNSAFKHNGKNQYYTVIPDLECVGIKGAGACKGDLPLVDATTATISSVYMAAMTNPFGRSLGGAPRQGWVDRYGTDIASCGGATDRITGPTGVTWTVQQIWSEKRRTCLTDPTRPYLIKK